ncbi:MAG: glycosyltransferase [Phycisphaerales bacterium]|nr:glycosyltransferase [Phycisphaerales bacterium]
MPKPLSDRVRLRVDSLVRAAIGLLPPDGQVLWAWRSAAALRRVVQRERIDAIYSTYSPASNHLLAWRLKRATGIPWVADFRDLWTQDCWYPFAGGPRWRVAIDRYLERRFLEDADALVCTTPDQTRILAERVPHLHRKFTTIPNGVDFADFPGGRDPWTSSAGSAAFDAATSFRAATVKERTSAGSPAGSAVGESIRGRENLPTFLGPSVPSSLPRSDRFILAHVGRFTRERVTDEMIDGLSAFTAALSDDARRFELRIVGWMPDALHRLLTAAGIPFTACGHVPHRTAIREMLDADALLLQYPDRPNADTAISGKLFEYFAAGRPVVMIGPRTSITRRLVEALAAGIGIDPQPDAIEQSLMEMWRQWRDGRMPTHCQPDRLTPFTRRNLTGELADVLDVACRGSCDFTDRMIPLECVLNGDASVPASPPVRRPVDRSAPMDRTGPSRPANPVDATRPRPSIRKRPASAVPALPPGA